jgi:hypothetical protein
VTILDPITGLIVAASVIPPLLLLYFLKLRRRSIGVSSTLLWHSSVEDLRANVPFQRIRASLLLILQLLILILLILAVMRPQIEGVDHRDGRTVILIDRSASMGAVDAGKGKTRLQAAKEQAIEQIETLHGRGLFASGGGRTMVIAFDDTAQVVAPFTDSRRQLVDAVASIVQTDGRSSIGEALSLSRAFLTRDDPESQSPLQASAALELYSDGRIGDLHDQVLRGEVMTFHRLGDPETGNIAIESISGDRPFDAQDTVEIFASLINYHDRPVESSIQLTVNGAAVSVQNLSIPGRAVDTEGELVAGRTNLVFPPFALPAGGVIEAVLLKEESLEVDNIASLVIPPPRELRVLLVSSRRSLIWSALEGMALEELFVQTPAQWEASIEDGSTQSWDVTVLDEVSPESLPSGRYLILGGRPPMEGLNPFGESTGELVLDARHSHPVMRYVETDRLIVGDHVLTQPSDDVEILLHGTKVPLILAVRHGSVQAVYTAFHPLQGTWKAGYAMVLFLSNAVDWLGRGDDAVTTRGLNPADAISARVPLGVATVSLEHPDGTVETAPVTGTRFVVGPVTRSGIHRVTWIDPATRQEVQQYFPVNIDVVSEGRIDAVESIRLGQEEVIATVGEATGRLDLWPWFLGVALVLIVVEWWLFHRQTMG